jgi:alpha-beta hydrolase superfamily lysophospholipase
LRESIFVLFLSINAEALGRATFVRMKTSELVAVEKRFSSWDGTQLFYRAWMPASPTQKALILIHRGHEHSGRWHEVVEDLALDDIAVFAWDARGHGESPGERGSAENIMALEKDLDAFVRHISDTNGIPVANTIVMAHSVGAVIAAAWVHDFAPAIRGLVLATPAFRVKLYMPFAIPLLRLKEKFFGPGIVKSYVKSRVLTHDPQQARRYDADEKIFRQISVKVLLDLFDTSTRLLADAGAITTPVLMLSAGNDWVVELGAQRKFFAALSSPIKGMEVFPDTYHAVFHERNRSEIIARAKRFIVARFDEEPRPISLLDADQRGYTKREYDALRTPGNPIFAIVRAAMKTVGRLSDGIKLGWKDGFDSGVTLDYVYANRPTGKTVLGKAIDRGYLESIGWRGIRQRKIHLEKILERAIRETAAAGKPAHIVDIAAGGGRYVLETLQRIKDVAATAVLRDYKPVNIDAAAKLAGRLGLEERVTVNLGDAFDRADLSRLEPRPTIAIVSGLYELFPANRPVLESLRGLAEAVPPGGFLIYTNQPWHPQVEFIARVLTNREGEPWIMRRRTQAEMDQLVSAAGFEKLAMEIDPWGIFTVSLARRRES